MEWNIIAFVRMILNIWKRKKRVPVAIPKALKQELKDKRKDLKDKKKAKDDKEKKDKKK